VQLSEKLYAQPNIAFSQNTNVDFVIDDNGTPVNLGDTEISYSPSIVAGNALTYRINKGFEVSFLSKYVGEQFLDNTQNDAAKLDAYFVNDLNAMYIWKPSSLVKEVAFSALVNNIFNVEYESNGYAFPGFVAFFPQAGINFLTGVTVTF
jgi:iron complex outermembrane receptor protein